MRSKRQLGANNDLKKLLERDMKKVGYTNSRLSSQVGIHPSYLSHLRSDTVTRNPTADVVVKLAKALDADIDEYLTACNFDVTKKTQKKKLRPVVLGIGGPSASGKSWLAKKISEHHERKCHVLSLDGFYFDDEKIPDLRFKNDDPQSLDVYAAVNAIEALRNGEEVDAPICKYKSGKRTKVQECIPGNLDLVVVEGIFLFNIDSINLKCDFTIWVDAPEHELMQRRICRDVKEREIPLEEVVERYYDCVIPGFNKFILPKKGDADLVFVNERLADLKKVPKIVNAIWAYAASFSHAKFIA